MPCSTQYLVVPPDAGGLNDKVRCIKLYKGKLLKYCAYTSFTYVDIVDNAMAAYVHTISGN